MSRYHAVFRDCCVDLSRLTGSVRYVFDRVCYVAAANDRLVPVVSEETGYLPGCIGVGLPADDRFSDHVAAGATATIRGGILRFQGGGLAVDLRAAAASQHPPRGWLSSHQSIACRSPLIGATSAAPGDVSRLVETSKKMLGLGPGLTPAGDDYIVGVAAGLWLASPAGGADDPYPAFADWLRGAASRTSDVSQIFLLGAARGAFPERLVSLCHRLLRGTGSGPATSLGRMAAFGHSSGALMSFGLIHALKAIPAQANQRVAA